MPYISDENAGEDPDIRVTVKDDGQVRKRLIEAFITKGKPFVFDKIREYVNAMAKGGPAKDDLEGKKVVAKKASSSSSSADVGSAGNNSALTVKESKKKEEKNGKDLRR